VPAYRGQARDRVRDDSKKAESRTQSESLQLTAHRKKKTNHRGHRARSTEGTEKEPGKKQGGGRREREEQGSRAGVRADGLIAKEEFSTISRKIDESCAFFLANKQAANVELC